MNKNNNFHYLPKFDFFLYVNHRDLQNTKQRRPQPQRKLVRNEWILHKLWMLINHFSVRYTRKPFACAVLYWSYILEVFSLIGVTFSKYLKLFPSKYGYPAIVLWKVSRTTHLTSRNFTSIFFHVANKSHLNFAISSLISPRTEQS